MLACAFGEDVWDDTPFAERREKYRAKVASWPLYFTQGQGAISIDDLRRWVFDLKALGVHHFFVDHLHFCLDEPEEWKLAVKFAQDLKQLVNEADIHMDIIIQPAKIADGAQLNLYSMRGGAGIGQAVDNVLIFERVKDPEHKNLSRLKLEVARHKKAKQGDYILLQYDQATTRFCEMEKKEAEVVPHPRPETPYSQRGYPILRD
jgi:hypothetical protein